jgi:hypothetical protein
MDKCKSNVVWKFGPFKVLGDHFYLIEEVHSIVATPLIYPENLILVKRCQNCKERKDITNLAWFDVEQLVTDYPMAFNRDTLKVLKNELSR